MKILDTQTGTIHEYGTDCHDSLYVSQDGRYLTYYDLQNGDGSGVGDYRFVCDDDKIPAESETADAMHAHVFFNIGGWSERSRAEWIPVNERLPNQNGCYIVTRIIEDTAISEVCYFDGQNTWHNDNRVNHGRPYLNDITAWQPLPEPYQKGGAK